MAQPFESDFWSDVCPPALRAALQRSRPSRLELLKHFAELWARYVPRVAPGEGDLSTWVSYFTEDAQFTVLLALARNAITLPVVLAVGSLVPCVGAEGLADVNNRAALFDTLAAHGLAQPESGARFDLLPFHPLFSGKAGRREPRRTNPDRIARIDLRTDMQTPPFVPWQHRARVLRFLDYYHCLLACVRNKQRVRGASGREYLLTGALRYGLVTEEGTVLQLCVGAREEFVYCVDGDPIPYADGSDVAIENRAAWNVLFERIYAARPDAQGVGLTDLVPQPPSLWVHVAPEERAAMLCYRVESGEEARYTDRAFRDYLAQWRRAQTAYQIASSKDSRNVAGVEGLTLPVEVMPTVLLRPLCGPNATVPVRCKAQLRQQLRVPPRVRVGEARPTRTLRSILGWQYISLRELGQSALEDTHHACLWLKLPAATPDMLAGALLTRLVEHERGADNFVLHLRGGAYFRGLLSRTDRAAILREWSDTLPTGSAFPAVQAALQQSPAPPPGAGDATKRWPFLHPRELETALLWLDYSEAIFTALRFPGARIRVVGDEGAEIMGGNLLFLWDQRGRLYVPLPIEEIGAARGAHEAQVYVYAARTEGGWLYIPCGEGREGSLHETVRRENALEWHIVSKIAAGMPACVTELRAFAAARARLGAASPHAPTTLFGEVVRPAPQALAPPLEWGVLDTRERRAAAHQRWWIVRCREAYDAAVEAKDPGLMERARREAHGVSPLEVLMQPDSAAWADFWKSWRRTSREAVLRTAPAWIQTFRDPETAGPPPTAVTDFGRERDCGVMDCLNVATSCARCKGRVCALHASLHRCVACAHCSARVGLAQQCTICRLEVCRPCVDRREGTRCSECDKLLGCPRTPHLVRGALEDTGDPLCENCRANREDREGGAPCVVCGLPFQYCFCVRDFPDAPAGVLAARAEPPPALALGASEYAEDDEAEAATGPEYTCGVCEQRFRPAFASRLGQCSRCMGRYLCDKCVHRNCRHCAPCAEALAQQLEAERAAPPPSAAAPMELEGAEEEVKHGAPVAMDTQEPERMRDVSQEPTLCAWCGHDLGRAHQRCYTCPARLCAICATRVWCPPCTRRSERPEQACAHCRVGARTREVCAACQRPTCGCSRAQLCAFRGCSTLVRCSLEGAECSRCARVLCRAHANRCPHCVGRAESAEARDPPATKLKRAEAARTSELVGLAARGIAERQPTPYKARKEAEDDEDDGGPDQ